MMDVLYIVGPESGHRNRELRWSLRSLEKFGRNLGRVVVAGYPPDWLAPEVVRVPCEDVPGESKFRNQWRCLYAALNAGAVDGEFLLACDDNVYTAPVDLDATPFYFRRRCLPEIGDGWPKDSGYNYRQFLAATREALVAEGYPARDCEGHQNSRCDTRDADEALRIVLAHPSERGWGIASMFINVRALREHIKWTHRPDIKLRRFSASEVATEQFSFDDPAFEDPRFEKFMAESFGGKCRFEA